MAAKSKELQFRPLEADEIEVRVAQCKKNGLSLLLYKDARCDMRMLDETVGAENWECSYEEIHNALYCSVRLYDAEHDRWVSKEDCGIPSNMDGTKGEASDAFKRACFKWGIGRELYTAPFIWITSDDCEIKYAGKDSKGKDRYTCYDRFSVKSIDIKDGKICGLTIWNENLRRVVWSNQKSGSNRGKNGSSDESDVVSKAEFVKVVTDAQIGEYYEHVNEFAELCGRDSMDVQDAVMNCTSMRSNGAAAEVESWTPEQMKDAMGQLNAWIDKAKAADKIADDLADEDIPF